MMDAGWNPGEGISPSLGLIASWLLAVTNSITLHVYYIHSQHVGRYYHDSFDGNQTWSPLYIAHAYLVLACFAELTERFLKRGRNFNEFKVRFQSTQHGPNLDHSVNNLLNVDLYYCFTSKHLNNCYRLCESFTLNPCYLCTILKITSHKKA